MYIIQNPESAKYSMCLPHEHQHKAECLQVLANGTEDLVCLTKGTRGL